MQKLIAALAVASLMAVAMPANAATNHSAKNIAFLEEMTGVANSNEMMTLVVNGENVEMTIAEAYTLMGEMTARVDLRAASENAVGGLANAGDIAFLAFGCAFSFAGTQPLFLPIDYQLWVYPGSSARGTCGATSTYGYTDKTAEYYSASTVAGVGSVINFFGLWLGSIDGAIVKA